MLAFALSKMNLLILVTALFAIIAYFMFGLTGHLITIAAGQIASAKAEAALGIANSEQMCFSAPLNLPYSIKYFGEARDFFYAMKISREPETTVQGQNNTLIFSIANRIKLNEIIASKGIDVNAEIALFAYDGKTTFVEWNPKAIWIDPQAEYPVNSFVIVKETYLGQNYLYVIACSFSGGVCESNLTAVADPLHPGKKGVWQQVKDGDLAPGVPAHDSPCLRSLKPPS